MAKTNITELYEVCTMCAGRGQEPIYGSFGTSGQQYQACRLCSGSGYRMVERTVVTETDPEVPHA